MTHAIDEVMEAKLKALLREVARDEILPYFRRLEAHRINSKSDASDLVTSADFASERRISAGVKKLLPQAMIIGEEAVSETPSLLEQAGNAELCAIIDPIDGTWNFAKGLPLFGVMLAIVENGQTIFGLIYDPITDTALFAHAGGGAIMEFPNGTKQPLVIDTEAGGTTGIVPVHFIPRPLRAHMTPILERYDRIMGFRCSAHEYWLMASGGIDFCLAAQLKPWDHAAGELIYREAGGYAFFGGC